MPTKAEIDRAWDYHKAADELLHSRSEALMIAQAFLIVAYFQVLTAEAFAKRTDMMFVCILLALVVLAVLITVILLRVNTDLSNGIRTLKRSYLVHDTVYAAYLTDVEGASGTKGSRGAVSKASLWKSYPRLWSKWLPLMFLGFWVLAGANVLLLLTGYVDKQ